MGSSGFVPYRQPRIPQSESQQRGEALLEELDRRRSVRFFTDEPVPQALIELAIRCASTAPSGAHRQPWRFAAVSSVSLKRRIREAAEEEERRNYGGRMPPAWMQAIAPMGTNAEKPFLEIAPWLVVVFAEMSLPTEAGERRPNYYVRESVGIACGLFIASLHRMGLATLTHTPSPMRFLGEILGRPKNEQAYVLFPVGYPAPDCVVPDLERKSLDDVALFFTE